MDKDPFYQLNLIHFGVEPTLIQHIIYSNQLTIGEYYPENREDFPKKFRVYLFLDHQNNNFKIKIY